jgi:hypothetical protein
MEERTVIRVVKDREHPYVILNKDFLENDALSWKAKGLLAYLLSRPDDWTVIVRDLIRRSKDGRDSVYAALKELTVAGYLEMELERDGGKFARRRYVVYERPRENAAITASSPHTEKPDTVKPDTVNPPLLSIKKSLPRTDLNNERPPPSGRWRNGTDIPQKRYPQRQHTDSELESCYWIPGPAEM